MKLYHGSNLQVKSPRLLEKQRNLDFGSGFYLTTSKQQAKNWAIYKANRFHGEAILSIFEIDETFFSQLNVKQYHSPTVEWLDMISNFRMGKSHEDDFDLIIGPVADDGTMDVLQSYFLGILKPEQAIENLMTFKLKDQYVFKTTKALKLLTFIGGENVGTN